MNWVRRGTTLWHAIATRDALLTVLRCTGEAIATTGTHVSARRPGPARRCPACNRISLIAGATPEARRALGARVLARYRQGHLRPIQEEP